MNQSAVQSLLKGVKELGDMEARFASLASIEQAIGETRSRLDKLHAEEATLKASLSKMRAEVVAINEMATAVLAKAKAEAEAEVTQAKVRARAEYQAAKNDLDKKLDRVQVRCMEYDEEIARRNELLNSVKSELALAQEALASFYADFDNLAKRVRG